MRKRGFIIWIEKDPPPVYETTFSYRFCPEKTASLTGFGLLKVPDGTSGREIYHLCRQKGLKEGPVIVVTWPETVISKEAAGLLYEKTPQKTLTGPVFNDSLYPSQQADLPCPYLDVPTFEELANSLATKTKEIETEELDPACFACHLEDLALFEDFSPEDISKTPLKKKILTGALVHVFRRSFEAERKDLLQLIPEKASPLLDVGCAKGGFGRLLKEKNDSLKIEGVELSPSLAKKAREIYDKVYVGRFEEIELPKSYYQVVHMGDVLEHLYDPWSALQKVREILRPGGFFTGSVPNISHWSIINQLLRGDFEYLPLGLLCVSHIRFFTPASLRRLLEETGFRIDLWEEERPEPTPQGKHLLQILEKNGLLRGKHLLTTEILFRAKRYD